MGTVSIAASSSSPSSLDASDASHLLSRSGNESSSSQHQHPHQHQHQHQHQHRHHGTRHHHHHPPPPSSPSTAAATLAKRTGGRGGSPVLYTMLFLLAFSMGFNSAMFLVFFRGNDSYDVVGAGFGDSLMGTPLRQQSIAAGGTRTTTKATIGDKNLETNGGGGATLSCERHGGPSDKAAAEMIYWYDIPSDADFRSPFKSEEAEEKFMTFEPDVGGWNNIRMSMETMVALAHAMGRTLVLPPRKRMYLLTQEGPDKQETKFNFADFFDLEALGKEHAGIDVISMDDFLENEALAGKFTDLSSPNVDGRLALFPPMNRTNWDGDNNYRPETPLNHYLRKIANTPDWTMDECMAVFPSHPNNTLKMERLFSEVMSKGLPSLRDMERKDMPPPPVDGPTIDRMRDLILRRRMCLYDQSMQDASVVHFRIDESKNIRLLVHFYAFLFFEDWRHDLHMKRLIRDHLHYLDELQCAAARVVSALRERARAKDPIDNPKGLFDTMHIRRGDFQYKSTRVGADVLFNSSKAELTRGSTVYISTDEKDKSFFRPFAEAYDICFLDDFRHLLEGVNTNYHGMIEQLIASRGRIFYGTFFSTFTGYINRLRGYHADKARSEGYERGIIESYYFLPEERKLDMRRYRPVHGQFWMREFPAAWRDINKGVVDL